MLPSRHTPACSTAGTAAPAQHCASVLQVLEYFYSSTAALRFTRAFTLTTALVLSLLNSWRPLSHFTRVTVYICHVLTDCVLLSTDCASSGRLVGTFLSVCALTVLCGLVVVAMSRLLLQKNGRTPGGNVQGVYHCTGKVSCQKTHTRFTPAGTECFRMFCKLFTEMFNENLESVVGGTAVYFISSLLPAHRPLHPDL